MIHRTNRGASGVANTLSRREILTLGAVGVSTLGIAGARAVGAASGSASESPILHVKAIHQEVDFHAPPLRIYEALLGYRPAGWCRPGES